MTDDVREALTDALLETDFIKDFDWLGTGSSWPSDEYIRREVSDLATQILQASEVTVLLTPPADDDDVREALSDSRKVRQRYAERGMKRGGWKHEVRPYGMVTDAEALRLGKVAWVAYQDDKAWAESVVEDCFSPADDLPEEALDMIAVARSVLEAARGG